MILILLTYAGFFYSRLEFPSKDSVFEWFIVACYCFLGCLNSCILLLCRLSHFLRDEFRLSSGILIWSYWFIFMGCQCSFSFLKGTKRLAFDWYSIWYGYGNAFQGSYLPSVTSDCCGKEWFFCLVLLVYDFPWQLRRACSLPILSLTKDLS